MTPYLWGIVAVGLIFLLILMIPAVKLATEVVRKRSGTSSTTALSTPSTMTTIRSEKIKRIIQMIILIGLLAFVWIWWQETHIGLKIQTLISTHVGQGWVPYGMQYFPTAIILWLMWQIIFGTTGGGKTIMTVLIWGVGLLAVTLLILHFTKGRDESLAGEVKDAPDIAYEGQKVTGEFVLGNTIRTYAPQHPTTGKAYRMCIRVVGPAFILKLPEAQYPHFRLEDPTGQTGHKNLATLNPDLETVLIKEYNYRKIFVEYEYRTKTGEQNPCPWTAWIGKYTAQAQGELDKYDRQRP